MKKDGYRADRIENVIYNTSIKKTLVVVFVFFMLTALAADAILVYSQWHRSAELATESLVSDINQSISKQLRDFFIFLHILTQQMVSCWRMIL